MHARLDMRGTFARRARARTNSCSFPDLARVAHLQSGYRLLPEGIYARINATEERERASASRKTLSFRERVEARSRALLVNPWSWSCSLSPLALTGPSTGNSERRIESREELRSDLTFSRDKFEISITKNFSSSFSRAWTYMCILILNPVSFYLKFDTLYVTGELKLCNSRNFFVKIETRVNLYLRAIE